MFCPCGKGHINLGFLNVAKLKCLNSGRIGSLRETGFSHSRNSSESPSASQEIGMLLFQSRLDNNKQAKKDWHWERLK